MNKQKHNCKVTKKKNTNTKSTAGKGTTGKSTSAKSTAGKSTKTRSTAGKKRKTLNTKKARRRLYKKIRKTSMIPLGIVLIVICIILLFGGKGYRYPWENCGKEAVTEEFLEKVLDISKQLDIDPDDLMTVMAFESRLDPGNVNRFSGATGLIQWMPETAAELGTSTEALKNMTAVEQLDYVYKYLKPYKGKMRSISDLYMTVLWPAAVGKEEDYVLFKSGTVAYRQNDGLDMNEDGLITKAEATQRVIQNRNYYFDDENK